MLSHYFFLREKESFDQLDFLLMATILFSKPKLRRIAMNSKEIVQNNKILETYIGSRMYGTSTPDSDVDVAGVFILPFSVILGLTTIEEVNDSVISKNQDGKNTKDAIDITYYSFHKFINLAIGGSPNIIERLFIPSDKIIYINEFGQRLIERRHSFLTKKIVPRFLGYATSQRHKMIIRTENFTVMNSFFEFLKKFESRQVIIEIKNDKNYELFGDFKGDHFVCGDIAVNRTAMIKDAKRIVEERLSKVSNRKELILKHGYETKFSSHLIRLLMECKEILSTGNLILPLNYADHIKDIKIGKFKINEVLDEATQLENELRELKDKSDLPEHEDFNGIDSFVVQMTKEWNNAKS